MNNEKTKTMKLYYYIIGMLMILFTACQKEDSGSPLPPDGGQNINDVLTVNSTTGEVAYLLREKSAWTAVVESGEWLKLAKTEGSENETVQLVYEPTTAAYPEAKVVITHKTGTIVNLTVKYEYIPYSLDNKLKVMQMDLWDGGANVNDSYNVLVAEILEQDADIVTLSDIGTADFSGLTAKLAEAGKTYYSSMESSTPEKPTSMILSKYEVVETENSAYYSKISVAVDGVPVSIYSVNMPDEKFAWHLPRGYNGGYGASGKEWAKAANGPVTDFFEIYEKNNQSERIEVAANIAAAISDDEGFVIVSGNFNEPSYLDWTAETKDMYDHHGLVYDWDVSVKMQQAGMIDTYRTLYPSAVTHPGFTYPADNKMLVEGKSLSIATEADERERLDFIYFREYRDGERNIRPESMSIIGSNMCIVKNAPKQEESKDTFVSPKQNIPGNHKGVVATFLIPKE